MALLQKRLINRKQIYLVNVAWYSTEDIAKRAEIKALLKK